MEDQKRIDTAKAIAAYLLNKENTVSITGPKEKVEKLGKSLTELKEILIKTVEDEDLRKKATAGIIGFILGKNTGIKFKGKKQDIQAMIKAINNLKNSVLISKNL